MSKKKHIEEIEKKIEILKSLVDVYKNSSNSSDESDFLEEDGPKETHEQFIERWKKESCVKEYLDFTEWCFGDLRKNGFSSIEKLVLDFSKTHPDLPLLKYVDERGFNDSENIIIVLLQAYKHYLNRKG